MISIVKSDSSKERLRVISTDLCNKLSLDYRDTAQSNLLDNLKPILLNKYKIAVYNAYGWEINLDKVIDYCKETGKLIFQPIACRDSRVMSFIPHGMSDKIFVSKKEYCDLINIRGTIEIFDLDLILLPVVAVDRRGYRLGKGGGYYDATLSGIKQNNSKDIVYCGVGYLCQLIEKIDCDAWDIRLDYFASEAGLIQFKG